MPDEAPAEEPTPTSPAGAEPTSDASTTLGGYSYTIVDDSGTEGTAGQAVPRSAGVPLVAAAAAIVVAAALAGVLVWLFAPSGGDGGAKSRLSADVANVLNAFSQGQSGTTTTRYEGELPPGFPADLPKHAKAKVVSSIAQVHGEDISYLVIWDTDDPRDSVAEDYRTKFSADPWQIDVTQDGRESTLHQFSKIDDPDIAGLVLVTESKGGKTATILTSVQVTSGGKSAQAPPFVAVAPRALPDGFPGDVPPYTGATLIESTYQQKAGTKSYAASYITKDDASGVLDFYRSKLQDAKLTVQDGNASQSTPTDAEMIQFADDKLSLRGGVTVGKFAEDDTYTRIDVTVQVTKQ